MLKDFIKNDFELMISIYLLIKRNNLFSQFLIVYNFQKTKNYLHLLYQKNSL